MSLQLNRRGFLGHLAAAPLAFNTLPFGGRGLLSAIGGDLSDRVLVLIQLNGGNDGLNTFIPTDQYDRLANARPHVTLPLNRLLRSTDTQAFHPSFAGARGVFDDGRMAILQDIGYPDHNRSHFRSLDIYNTASAADEVLRTGWLGRLLERDHPGFPTGYPSTRHPDPIAVSMGVTVAETCQGSEANFSMAVADPTRLTSVLDVDVEADPTHVRYLEELAFLGTNATQANGYATTVAAAAERGRTNGGYPATEFGQQLSNVAKLISGGLRSKVYVVTLGGFDTHADQVVPGQPDLGIHANLLRELGDGIAAFQADVTQLGLGERVLGMTYSEFGRRIRSNAANGTDHGTASPGFVFGECVLPGVLGANPVIPEDPHYEEGVPMQLDFRDVHGTVLEDWFGLREADVRQLIYPAYQRLPFLRDCGGLVDVAERVAAPANLSIFPNPFRARATLRFQLESRSPMVLSVHDASGALVETLFSGTLHAGEHEVRVQTTNYPRGLCFFRVRAGGLSGSVRAVRL